MQDLIKTVEFLTTELQQYREELGTQFSIQECNFTQNKNKLAILTQQLNALKAGLQISANSNSSGSGIGNNHIETNLEPCMKKTRINIDITSLKNGNCAMVSLNSSYVKSSETAEAETVGTVDKGQGQGQDQHAALYSCSCSNQGNGNFEQQEQPEAKEKYEVTENKAKRGEESNSSITILKTATATADSNGNRDTTDDHDHSEKTSSEQDKNKDVDVGLEWMSSANAQARQNLNEESTQSQSCRNVFEIETLRNGKNRKIGNSQETVAVGLPTPIIYFVKRESEDSHTQSCAETEGASSLNQTTDYDNHNDKELNSLPGREQNPPSLSLSADLGKRQQILPQFKTALAATNAKELRQAEIKYKKKLELKLTQKQLQSRAKSNKTGSSESDSEFEQVSDDAMYHPVKKWKSKERKSKTSSSSERYQEQETDSGEDNNDIYLPGRKNGPTERAKKSKHHFRKNRNIDASQTTPTHIQGQGVSLLTTRQNPNWKVSPDTVATATGGACVLRKTMSSNNSNISKPIGHSQNFRALFDIDSIQLLTLRNIPGITGVNEITGGIDGREVNPKQRAKLNANFFPPVRNCKVISNELTHPYIGTERLKKRKNIIMEPPPPPCSFKGSRASQTVVETPTEPRYRCRLYSLGICSDSSLFADSSERRHFSLRHGIFKVNSAHLVKNRDYFCPWCSICLKHENLYNRLAVPSFSAVRDYFTRCHASEIEKLRSEIEQRRSP